MIRTTAMLSGAALAIAALTVALCADDDTGQKRPTRIVCTAADGRVVHDDFVASDDSVTTSSGFLVYRSETTQGTTRVGGSCASYPATRQPSWRPVIEGRPG